MKYDTFEDVPSTLPSAANECPSVALDTASLSRLSRPTSRLNDDCINTCGKLLYSLFPSQHANNCAILSTYVLADHRNPIYDDNRTWRNSKSTEYWTKGVWIIPIHRLEQQHWVLCVINRISKHIDFFDSFAQRSEWMKDVQVSFVHFSRGPCDSQSTLQDVMTLISRLERTAIDHGYALANSPSGWTASPINASSLPIPNNVYG